MSRNISLDIGRLIASFFVVCLHTQFPIKVLSPFVADIAKFAVPYFFILSGFYLYNDADNIIYAKSKKTINKTIKILLKVVVVYGMLRIFKYNVSDYDFSTQKFNLIRFLVFNDINFTEHLWYLFAYIYVLIILALFAGKKKSDWLIKAFPLFFLTYSVITTWTRTISFENGKFLYELNWFTLALPFVICGMILQKSISKIHLIKMNYLYVTFILSGVLVFGEHYLFKIFFCEGPGVIMISVFAICFFLICYKDIFNHNRKTEIWISQIGKEHALNIYLYHVLVREIFNLLKLNIVFNNSISIFITTLFISFLLQQITHKTLKNENIQLHN